MIRRFALIEEPRKGEGENAGVQGQGEGFQELEEMLSRLAIA